MAGEKLSLQAWLTITSLILGIGAVGGTIASKVFATQDAVHAVSLSVEHAAGAATLQEWRLNQVTTRLENLESRQTRLDTNVVLILQRLAVKPAPEPEYKALPAAPEMPEVSP